ncbi:hypothetical protein CABS01_16662 [Colletotrichum abscissum]|uniref:uncharacterized protein n=1 Tax=Colletotrichum abscissum TaxID=1671311 RepID=UPI0027D48D0C|nr:uncharacterized protein CABS01_16662 [Colletotrichum abscissum]KAK1517395.1 hypothetical protein CABS01_16662 [Colletotrichum abscissum]
MLSGLDFTRDLTHWVVVVYEQFAGSTVACSGLREPLCVPLSGVRGFSDAMLDAMEKSGCLRSHWGFHDDYENPLTMIAQNTSM